MLIRQLLPVLDSKKNYSLIYSRYLFYVESNRCCYGHTDANFRNLNMWRAAIAIVIV